MLGGDFNCIFVNEDSRSGDSPNSHCFVGRDELLKFLRARNLVDCWLCQNPPESGHTWVHPGKKQSSRLDRIFVSSSLSLRKVTKLSFQLSDHDVVNAQICMPLSKSSSRKSYWKLNTSLLSDCKFDNEFRMYYSMWGTLKQAFASLREWWRSLKLEYGSWELFMGSV